MIKLIPHAIMASLLVSGSALGNDLKFTPGDDARFSWDSYNQLKTKDLSGETISIFGPWLGPDKDLIESVIDYFEKATGATVNYSGSDSFETQIVIDAEAGATPNISVFPQPGLAANLASKGHLAALDSKTADWLRENYAAGQSWVDLGTFKGKDGKEALYGFFYKVDVKSLVWYSPENFEDAGYEVPQTMEELFALSDQIVADGGTPWCIGIGSGGATGWPATDWVEDLMLRTQTPEDYDRWVTNTIKFDDPKVLEAIDLFGKFALNTKYTVGDKVSSVDFRDSPKGLFTSPPQCYLHRQASFIPAYFPKGTEVGYDADFFYFPAFADKKLGKPVLGAGTMFAITNDSKGARAFMEFLQTPIAHEIWMAQKGFLTPHKGVNTEVFTDPTVAKMNQILLNADTFRFDASDLMPGAIGAGAFWTGMVEYLDGTSAEDVAKDIQRIWDSIQ